VDAFWDGHREEGASGGCTGLPTLASSRPLQGNLASTYEHIAEVFCTLYGLLPPTSQSYNLDTYSSTYTRSREPDNIRPHTLSSTIPHPSSTHNTKYNGGSNKGMFDATLWEIEAIYETLLLCCVQCRICTGMLCSIATHNAVSVT
jgi:hypothetical protein